MNVVDSSGWLEYFADSPLASEFSAVIEDAPNLIVPAITLYEVNKRLIVQQRERDAMILMHEGKVVDLTATLSIEASRQAALNKLHLADSIIYATTMLHGAILWTTDKHFKGLPNVAFREKLL
jgi:toxin FitB